MRVSQGGVDGVVDIATVAFGIQNDLRRVKIPLGVAFVFLTACSAQAAWMTSRGGVATLRGTIEMGDAERLGALLKREPAIGVLDLDSHGGSVKGAIELGEAVRRARLATQVDAARSVCDSACTMIFAAGVARHYLNAETMQEGFSGLAGLGYHRSYNRGDRITPPMLSREGERLMIRYYRRMGAPAAVTLALRGTISSFWRPNAATALRLGLATSLSPPRLAAGRLKAPSAPRISGTPARASASSTTSRGN
jgi:hypothetical protein